MPRLSFVMLAVLFPTTAWAQPAVERLEKQVQQDLEASKAAPAAAAPAKPAAEAAPTAPAGPVAERGWLGAVTDDAADRGRGVRITRLAPGGPAEKGGLQANDLITGLGGVRVRSMDDFASIMEVTPPGTTLTFEVLRNNQRQQIDVTFAERPAKPEAAAPTVAPKSPPVEPTAPPPEPKTILPQPAPTTAEARIRALEEQVRQLEVRVQALEQAARAKQ